MSRIRYNETTRKQKRGDHLMSVATKEEATYAQRLETLRSAAGSLTTSKASTAALFSERNAERTQTHSHCVAIRAQRKGKKVAVNVRSRSK